MRVKACPRLEIRAVQLVAELDYIATSQAVQASFAENYFSLTV